MKAYTTDLIKEQAMKLWEEADTGEGWTDEVWNEIVRVWDEQQCEASILGEDEPLLVDVIREVAG